MKNGKSRAAFVLLLGIASFLTCACASATMKGYTGPDLPASQTATIMAGPLANIVSCDGVRLSGFQAHVNILPGSHTIDASFAWIDNGGNVAYSSRAIGSVTFNAEAGHDYKVAAEMDYSSDSWMVVVSDIGSHARIVQSKALPMDVYLRPRGSTPN